MSPRPKIDEEFKSLLPPMLPEEREGLKAKIRAEGFTDAGVVWEEEGILVDGHTRQELCDELGVRFHFLTMRFKDREEVLRWIVKNQLSKRNLTDEWREYFLGWTYARHKKERGGDKKSTASQKATPELPIDATPCPTTPESICQNDRLIGKGEGQGANTALALAQRNNVSERTVYRAEEFAKAADVIGLYDPGLKAAILAGTSGLSRDEVLRKGKQCKRCERVGQVQGCNACATLRTAKTRKAKKRASAVSVADPGTAKWWRDFWKQAGHHMGYVGHLPADLARAAEQEGCEDQLYLQRLWQDFVARWEQWEKAVRKEKA